jgi:hypothetical protein
MAHEKGKIYKMEARDINIKVRLFVIATRCSTTVIEGTVLLDCSSKPSYKTGQQWKWHNSSFVESSLKEAAEYEAKYVKQ